MLEVGAGFGDTRGDLRGVPLDVVGSPLKLRPFPQGRCMASASRVRAVREASWPAATASVMVCAVVRSVDVMPVPLARASHTHGTHGRCLSVGSGGQEAGQARNAVAAF